VLGVKENSIQNIKMSETPSAVVVPNSANGSASQAAAVTPMKGGMVLSPLPLSGGRKTKKLSKKVLNMFKKGSRGKLMKMMKGGSSLSPATVGGRRHTKRNRKH
jgi:hypothetical protein